ncbi:MAG: lysoplasmalogenase [Malacoplasma sp.]|nr:lysoplasmalogenase [Malacoplasma sp.]
MKSVRVDWKIQLAYYQKFLFTVACIFLSLVLFIITFVFETINHFNKSELYSNLYTIFKSLTSFVFVVMMFYSIFKLKFKRKIQHYFFMVFVLFCFMGDISINFNFLAGIIAFFAAHIFYIISCFFVSKFPIKKMLFSLLIYVVVLLVVNLMFGLNIFNNQPLYWVAVNFYALVLTTSLVLSIYIYTDKQSLYALYQLIALALFLVSDTLLMFNHFLVDNYKTDELIVSLNFFVLLTYYISMNISSINLKKITY